jgi:uncharacterized protein
VKLTLEKPGSHFFIRSVSPEGIRIADDYYPDPMILTASQIIADWPVRSVSDLCEKSLEPIWQLNPSVVLIGTGRRQIFPAPELMMCFYSRNVGVEIMTTDAACRTFNVLVSEQREVAAALMPVNA